VISENPAVLPPPIGFNDYFVDDFELMGPASDGHQSVLFSTKPIPIWAAGFASANGLSLPDSKHLLIADDAGNLTSYESKAGINAWTTFPIGNY
jgi:hypothetical protein